MEAVVMKRVVSGALLLVVLGVCRTARAETGVEPSVLQPASVSKTAFEYDNYLHGPNDSSDAERPRARPPLPGKSVAVPEPTSPSGEGGLIDAPIRDAVAADANPDAKAPADLVVDDPTASGIDQRVPWQLPQPRTLSNRGIKVGGWIQQGVTLNGDHPADGFNGPLCTNDFANEYQMNQAWLYFVKPTQTDGCGIDVGGRVDVVYGTDWRFGQSFGLETRIDSPNSSYGLILPQFYGEVAINDLTVKLGHFAAFTSYEVVPAPANFFYSHSYLMSGYFDPLLVTGLQGDYKVNDNWTAVAGFNRGWMMFEDPADTLNFLGGVKWTSDSKRSATSVMVDAGKQLNLFTGQSNDRTSFIAVFTHKLNEKLSYASQYTVGHEANGSGVVRGQDAEWYGTEQMLIYQINSKLSAAARYEWVRDDDGSRVFGIGAAGVPGWNSLPGFAGEFSDLSLGLNYRPLANIVFRPEVRWDWYHGPANGQGNLPFDGSNKNEQFTVGMDLLWTF
jgi:hypothetical protein